MTRVGRNDPCPCGSGKKFKHCCWAKEQATSAASQSAVVNAQLLQKAIAAHQEGNLSQARQGYQRILQTQPDHPKFLSYPVAAMSGCENFDCINVGWT